MISRGVTTLIDNFDRAQVYSTTPGHNGWTIKDTSSSGTPTYLNATEDGGSAVLTLANTSEEEVVTLYQNDVLMLDLAHLQRLWWIIKVAAVDSVTTIVAGVGSAQNNTEDSMATNAWFRLQGSASTSAVVVETDDATLDLDDKATGKTLGSTYKKLLLDFTYGLADVRFYFDGERVAQATKFDMSNLTAGLNVQPFLQLHKASGTGVPAVTIAQYGVQYAWAY